MLKIYILLSTPPQAASIVWSFALYHAFSSKAAWYYKRTQLNDSWVAVSNANIHCAKNWPILYEISLGHARFLYFSTDLNCMRSVPQVSPVFFGLRLAGIRRFLTLHKFYQVSSTYVFTHLHSVTYIFMDVCCFAGLHQLPCEFFCLVSHLMK
jgi:hypothetical protein